MDDSVKLVIKLPKYAYVEAKMEVAEGIYDYNGLNPTIFKAVSNGTPLDDVKSEIEKEIIPRNSDDYDHDIMFQNCGLRMALKIIDGIGDKI